MERQHKTGAWGVAAVMLILLLPLLYVLSTGPAVWLFNQGLISDEPMGTIYKPLELAVNTWPRCTAPVLWYVDLWDGPDVGWTVDAPLPQPPIPPPPPSSSPAGNLPAGTVPH